jgi:hypothetical protein
MPAIPVPAPIAWGIRPSTGRERLWTVVPIATPRHRVRHDLEEHSAAIARLRLRRRLCARYCHDDHYDRDPPATGPAASNDGVVP